MTGSKFGDSDLVFEFNLADIRLEQFIHLRGMTVMVNVSIQEKEPTVIKQQTELKEETKAEYTESNKESFSNDDY